MSMSRARDASASSAFWASAALIFQARAAVLAVKGLNGTRATSAASFSLMRIFRISKRSSDGGAPCGPLFRRRTSLSYPDRAARWAMRLYYSIFEGLATAKDWFMLKPIGGHHEDDPGRGHRD